MSKLVKRIRELRVPSFTFKPSTTMITLVLIVVVLFILGGGVYNVLERPLSVLPTPQNPVWYFQGMTAQTLNESLIFALFLTIGIAGGYIAFISTRRIYRPREARLYLAIGISMIFGALIGSEIVLSWKGL
ncbi:MAG: hypothetical protein JSV76_01105 [Candidatus Bathyarchaeota archaeon]|nr:MAG: hypothetical protein JSV76_01105 [Candidatus Bathyarchaeota archaeon]